MKIKSAIKYQMFELRYGFLIIYAIIYALLIFQIIINGSMDNISVSNTEFSTCGFLLIWGALTMRSYFSFFLQNGISRNTLFVSTVANSAILSAGMALVASLNALFLQLITSQSGFSFQRMYTYFLPGRLHSPHLFRGLALSYLRSSVLQYAGLFPFGSLLPDEQNHKNYRFCRRACSVHLRTSPL